MRSLTCVLCLLLTRGPALPQEPEALDLPELMHSLTESFTALEKAGAEGAASSVALHAVELGQLASLLAGIDLPGSRGPDHRDRASEALRSTTEALREQAEAGSLATLAEDVQALRHACVSCHLVHRKENQRGSFPAEGNTVFGRVRVRTLEGSGGDPADMVVFVDQVPGQWSPPGRRPWISQKNRQFSPAVLPVLQGTTVEFPNDDTVFHNVFSLSRAEPFDLGLYQKGESRERTFDRPGLVRLYCNIHPEMVASIVVLANPFFAQPDQDGFYCITGLPDGSFPLRTWNEFGGDGSWTLELQNGSMLRKDLEIRQDRRRMPHENKFGRPYREKYR